MPILRTGDREAGGLVVEAVLLVPVAMVVVLFAVQACLWARADQIVQSAAADGQSVAADAGGSPYAGVDAARRSLSDAGSAVSDVNVGAQIMSGDVVEIDVSAAAESIVPWLHINVTARRRGPIQEFRSSE